MNRETTDFENTKTSLRWPLAVTLVLLLAAGLGGYVYWRMNQPTILEQARALTTEGKRDEAIELLRQHLDRNPDDFSTRMRLVELLEISDPPQALLELQKVPADAEEYPTVMRRIAAIALVTRNEKESEQALQYLLERDKQDFAVQLSLAELYHQQKRTAEALPFAEAARDLKPNRAQTYLLIAEIMDDLHRPAEMVQPLMQAIRLEPSNYAAHLNLAYASLHAGDTQRVQREAEWCLVREPREVSAHRFLAEALRDEGDYAEAEAAIQKALKIDPLDIESRLLEAELLLFQRKAAEAWDRLIPLYEAQKQSREFLGLLARAAALSGRRERARELHQEILKLIPEENP